MTGDPPADSAGVPWQGRTLSPPPFAGDDGAPDPALERVLSGYAAGTADLADVVRAVTGTRLVVPVVARPGETSAEMATVTVRGRDGRVGLPLFTGVRTLAAWDAAARPVPVAARRAALSAVEEGADVVVLDVAGPVTVVLPRPAVWALAQGRPWVPSPADPGVAEAVRRALAGLPEVTTVRCEPGGRAELRVVLAVRPGLDRAGLDALTGRVSQRLAAEPVVAERVDSVELSLRPA